MRQVSFRFNLIYISQLWFSFAVYYANGAHVGNAFVKSKNDIKRNQSESRQTPINWNDFFLRFNQSIYIINFGRVLMCLFACCRDDLKIDLNSWVVRAHVKMKFMPCFLRFFAHNWRCERREKPIKTPTMSYSRFDYLFNVSDFFKLTEFKWLSVDMWCRLLVQFCARN